MFNVEIKGADRLDIEFGGKLNSDDMKAALDTLVEKSGDIRNGKMLYRIGDFDLPTLGACPRIDGLLRKSHFGRIFRLKSLNMPNIRLF